MRSLLRSMLPGIKWPMHVGMFIAHFMHHLAAFFAWAWTISHIVISVISAGFNINRVKSESWNFFDTEMVSWRTVVAMALVPAILVAFHRAWLAWREIRHRAKSRDSFLHERQHLIRWPATLAVFGASLAHHTAGFFGWLWLVLALVGALGQASFHLGTLTYFKNAGGDQWQVLLGLAAIPALLFAIWNAGSSYRALHRLAHEHRAEKAGSRQSA
jgi:hypothetical protein